MLKRLELLENELSLVLDPRQPGRGCALFATIEGGEVHRFAFQVSLPTRVVLDDRAYLAPLAAALDRGRPAGLVAVSLSAVRVVEQRLGVASEVTTFALESETSEWRELKGPAASNPALAQQTAPQRDLFERRLEEHRRRLLEDAGGRLRALAESQRWDRIVVAGDPRLAHVLGDALRGHDSDISVVESVLHGLSPSEIAEAVAPELERVSLRREEELVRRACDAALSGGRGALGLRDVLAVLDEHRVSHLLFDDRHQDRVTREHDGAPMADADTPARAASQEPAPEARPIASMLEQALANGVRVIPVSAAAASPLDGHDGVAALLRWQRGVPRRPMLDDVAPQYRSAMGRDRRVR